MSNILEEVQAFVADKLNADPQLSACPFLIENKKDIDFEIKNALGKQGIVGLVMTPKATFAGAFQDVGLAWQLDELEVSIVESVTVNRGKKDGYVTGQDASMRLFDVLCPLSGEGEGQFSPVSYEEGEDGSLLVNKCILKCLVHKDKKEPAWPTQQQVVFADGTTVRVSDLVFNDYFAMTNFCSYIGQSISNVVEADIFAQSLVYSLFSPFSSYTGMKKIYLAESVQEIYPNEFANMPQLEEVFFRGKTMSQVKAMDNYPWGITDTSIIHSELDPLEEYTYAVLDGELLSALYEGAFTNEMLTAFAPSSYTRITDLYVGTGIDSLSAFCLQLGNTLSSVVLPDTITDIGDGAFYMSRGLKDVQMKEGISAIGQDCFFDCRALRVLEIPSTVQTIGRMALKVTNDPYLPELSSVTFKGKTLEQVQAMADYPWGIRNIEVIHAEL